MIYTGADVITRARFILMDAGAKAFTGPELEAWLTDGRAVMYQRRPDLFETTATLTLVAGVRQTLPDSSTRLFAIDSNVSHKNKRAITLATDEVLARFRPQWRSMKPATEIEHYLYSEADGGEYEVYPPAVNGTTVQGSYAKPPGAATGVTALTEEAELGAAYVDYIVARAFQKESDAVPGFTDRANHHLGLFMAAIAGDAETKLTLSPNTQREGGIPTNARPT
jgi:hypothetical protein